MAKILRLGLLLLVVLLSVWNFFLRESINIPILSGFGPMVTWILVGALILAIVAINFVKREY